MVEGEFMQRIRKVAMVGLVWAMASSMLLASTPYYVCHCPDGTTKTHFVGSVSPDSSCCSSNCCSVGTKEKACCHASKKKPVVKSTCCSKAGQTQPQNPD